MSFATPSCRWVARTTRTCTMCCSPPRLTGKNCWISCGTTISGRSFIIYRAHIARRQAFCRAHGTLDMTNRQFQRLVHLPLWVGLTDQRRKRSSIPSRQRPACKLSGEHGFSSATLPCCIVPVMTKNIPGFYTAFFIRDRSRQLSAWIEPRRAQTGALSETESLLQRYGNDFSRRLYR